MLLFYRIVICYLLISRYKNQDKNKTRNVHYYSLIIEIRSRTLGHAKSILIFFFLFSIRKLNHKNRRRKKKYHLTALINRRSMPMHNTRNATNLSKLKDVKTIFLHGYYCNGYCVQYLSLFIYFFFLIPFSMAFFWCVW